MKSCLNCFNLVAKIPVRYGRINYSYASARCKDGMFTKENGEEKTVKRIFYPYAQTMKLFNKAQNCPYYDDRDE